MENKVLVQKNLFWKKFYEIKLDGVFFHYTSLFTNQTKFYKYDSIGSSINYNKSLDIIKVLVSFMASFIGIIGLTQKNFLNDIVALILAIALLLFGIFYFLSELKSGIIGYYYFSNLNKLSPEDLKISSEFKKSQELDSFLKEVLRGKIQFLLENEFRFISKDCPIEFYYRQALDIKNNYNLDDSTFQSFLTVINDSYKKSSDFIGIPHNNEKN